MPGLEPQIDIYGTYGRACVLADWLELAAIAGQRQTVGDLSDLIDDNGWASRPVRHFYTDPADYEDEELEAPENLADSAFLMLHQRRRSLRDKYPFDIDRGALRFAGGNYIPYLSLLAITVAHSWPAFDLRGAEGPENVLEAVVATVLQDRGLAVAQMGALDRGGKTFVENLREGGSAIGLRPTPTPVPLAIYAKDAGVDTLAALPWHDGRRGQWVLIGQVTCGRSDSWEEKLDRPKPSIWARYLQEPAQPMAFLAVPHHVESRHLEILLKAQRGIVLDRLRLATHELGVSRAERHLIDLVLEAGVSDGRAARSRAA